MSTTPSTKERAQDAAGTAAEEGRHVAGTAKEEAATVASEAATQARSVMNDAMGQVGDQSRAQKDKLASTLQTFGDDLESMASQAPGMASDVARQVAGQVRGIASHLENREPNELLEDVRYYARQRPGLFLLGALTAGVVAGRLLRGTADGIAAATATPGTSTGMGTTTGIGDQGTYVPSPSTETGTPHGQPTIATPGMDSPTIDSPSTPPMTSPSAGYGERGALGDDGGLR